MEKISSWTGFEPVREDPIGFRVQRLNHSAITTPPTRWGICSTKLDGCENLKSAQFLFSKWFLIVHWVTVKSWFYNGNKYEPGIANISWKAGGNTGSNGICLKNI